MREAFESGFITDRVRIKYVEALELKGTEKYLSDNETYTFDTLFRASEDFKVPAEKTMTMKLFKSFLNDFENNKNMEGKGMSKKIGNMDFEDVKKILENIEKNNHENYVKAIVSVEKGIDDLDLLDDIYFEFQNNDAFELISEDISDLIDKYSVIEKDIAEKDELGDTLLSEEDLEDMELDDEEFDDLKIDDEREDFEDMANGKEKEKDTTNLNGYMATNVEIKVLKNNKTGEKFKVANFSVAKNDDMGEVHYTKCTAYNDKIEKVKNFKKGDFVHIFGKEKLSYDNAGKEYVNLSVLSAKMLKEKTNYKNHDKVNKRKESKQINKDNSPKKKQSALKNLKQYKEKIGQAFVSSPKKSRVNER